MSVKLACELFTELIDEYKACYKEIPVINEIIYERFKLIIDVLRLYGKNTLDITKYIEFGSNLDDIFNNSLILIKKSIGCGIIFTYDGVIIYHRKKKPSTITYYVDDEPLEQYCNKCTYFRKIDSMDGWNNKTHRQHCVICTRINSANHNEKVKVAKIDIVDDDQIINMSLGDITIILNRIIRYLLDNDVNIGKITKRLNNNFLDNIVKLDDEIYKLCIIIDDLDMECTMEDVIKSIKYILIKSNKHGIAFDYIDNEFKWVKRKGKPKIVSNGIDIEVYCMKCSYWRKVNDENGWLGDGNRRYCTTCVPDMDYIRSKEIAAYEEKKKLPEYTQVYMVDEKEYRKCADCEKFDNIDKYSKEYQLCYSCNLLRLHTVQCGNNKTKSIHAFVDNNEHKYCFKCKNWKFLELFSKSNEKWDGLKTDCKTCDHIRSKKWREKYLDVIHIKDAIYRKSEHGRMIKRIYMRQRRSNDILFDLKCRLRSRLRSAINCKKSNTTMELTGCSLDVLKKHLEDQFINGMSWERRREIHIDHIIPCALYNLEDPEEQKCCFSYLNLQPMWARDNIIKGSKLTKEDYEKHRLRLCKPIRERLDYMFIDADEIEELCTNNSVDINGL